MLLLGYGRAVAFAVKRIRNSANAQNQRFQDRASEIVQAVENTWIEYETAALLVHQSLRVKTNYSTFGDERRNREVLYENFMFRWYSPVHSPYGATFLTLWEAKR